MSEHTKELSGKVAIVTGAGKGIGAAISLELANLGAAVVVNSASASCEKIAGQITAAGGTAKALAGDVASKETAESLVAAAQELGGLHILVNNAGITRDGLLMRAKDEDWDAVLDTNLKSAFMLARAACRPMMKNKWGRIVNITSIVGLIGNPGQASYCASKAGMVGLTKSLAKELASRNILVNAVAPGFIQTAMTDALNEEQAAAITGQIPLARYGQPEDIANAVAFLCTDRAAYITGQVIEVTGGLGM
ncbi:MAG: 3-oxoacyl-[acyl-carrier-protein] reductase [Sumerlaeia bacterium]